MSTPPPADWAAIFDRAHRQLFARLTNLAIVGAVGAAVLLAGGLIGRAAVVSDDSGGGAVERPQSNGTAGDETDTPEETDGGVDEVKPDEDVVPGKGEDDTGSDENVEQPPNSEEEEETAEAESAEESTEAPAPPPPAEAPPEEEFRAPR